MDVRRLLDFGGEQESANKVCSVTVVTRRLHRFKSAEGASMGAAYLPLTTPPSLMSCMQKLKRLDGSIVTGGAPMARASPSVRVPV